MPLNGTATQDDWLDAGVSTLPTVGATWRLFAGFPPLATGDPATELPADGGYAPVAASLADWAAAVDGAKVATVDFGISSAAWGDVATSWAWCDSSGAVVLWDLLPEPIEVSAAGTPVSFSPALYFRNDI